MRGPRRPGTSGMDQRLFRRGGHAELLRFVADTARRRRPAPAYLTPGDVVWQLPGRRHGGQERVLVECALERVAGLPVGRPEGLSMAIAHPDVGPAATAEWREHPWVTEGRGRVRLGVGVTTFAAPVDGGARLALARAVDELGLDSLWVPDHPTGTMDCWTSLAAYAAVTRRVRLGPMVSCTLYRSTAMTARQAADVDRLSNGRVVLGIGAGWVAEEFRVLGVPFPEPRERLAALTRTLQELPRLWYGQPLEFNSATGTMTGEAFGWPPVQEPRIPILVGGSGEQVTLKRVAQHADMCSIEDRKVHTPDELRAKYTALRAHCAVVGRPYESVIKSWFLNSVVLAPTRSRVEAKIAALGLAHRAQRRQMCKPDELVDVIRPMVAAGTDYVVVNLTSYEDVETVELLATRVAAALQP
jgi:alkanesulfonate monooxygenase SsuD/methylene tetrahydromethanopterin reductase-like flavin-dependent oxidoreductase (luciferase family)